jgi:hypothetical protein
VVRNRIGSVGNVIVVTYAVASLCPWPHNSKRRGRAARDTLFLFLGGVPQKPACWRDALSIHRTRSLSARWKCHRMEMALRPLRPLQPLRLPAPASTPRARVKKSALIASWQSAATGSLDKGYSRRATMDLQVPTAARSASYACVSGAGSCPSSSPLSPLSVLTRVGASREHGSRFDDDARVGGGGPTPLAPQPISIAVTPIARLAFCMADS